MSSGERSCKYYGDYEVHKDMKKPYSCDVDCFKYEWDGITKPDSKNGDSKLFKDLTNLDEK